MMRLWEIFEAIGQQHWRLSDAAKLAGNDAKQGHHMQLGEAYTEASTVLKAKVRDRTADETAIIDRAMQRGIYPAVLLGEIGLPAYYARMSAIEGERA
jgi:hypothetical protein